MIGSGFGGGERLFVDLALSLADRGHTVQAICHTDFVQRGLLEAHPGIQVSPVKVRCAWDFWALFQIRNHLRRFAPDIVHVHMSRGASFGGRAAHPLNIPVVATLHNYHKLKYYTKVNEFACITPDLREYLLRQGIADERITVIPNFARFPAVDAPRAVFGSPVRFVTCGRLHAVKGYDVLLRALRIVLDAGGQAQLTIGGDGPERAALVSLTRELRLEQAVEFAGWIDDVSEFLDRHDVFVLSSRSESFGIALLEAMARGLPLVTTRTAGPVQFLDAACAVFAEVENPQSLAEAMLLAVRTPTALAPLAAEALHRYRTRYAEAVCVPHYVEFYEQVTARARHRGGR